jgi:uncharacterized FlaG/YvyC family protein
MGTTNKRDKTLPRMQKRVLGRTKKTKMNEKQAEELLDTLKDISDALGHIATCLDKSVDDKNGGFIVDVKR